MFVKNNLFLRLIILSVFYVQSSIAEEAELETVQIKATLPDSYSIYSFAGHNSSIDISNYKNRFTSLTDVLEQQAGIDIASVSGVGQYSTPIIRGAEGQQILAFHDGILLNDINGGAADIGSTSLTNIDSIEIYRGFVPMELSPTAIGGAINFVSKERLNNEGQAGYTLGSYGVQSAFLNQSITLNKSNLSLALTKTSADNDFIYKELSPINTPNTPKNEPRYNNGSDLNQAQIKLIHPITNNQKITFQTEYKYSLRELAGKINSENRQTNISNELYAHQAKFENSWSKTHTSSLQIGFKKNNEIYDDRGGEIGLGLQHNQYRSNLTKLNLNHKIKGEQFNIVFNQQFNHENIEIQYLNIPNSDKETCIDSGYCDAEYWRKQDSSGFRLEWTPNPLWFISNQIVYLRNNDKLEQGKDQKSGFSFYSGVNHQLTTNLSASMNFSQQIRPPATTELLGDRGNVIGNSDLENEKSRSFEIGLALTSNFIDSSFYLFKRYVDDNIYAQQDSRGILKYSNLAETSYNGVEASLHTLPYFGISYNFSYTYQSGIIDKNQNEALEGNQIGDHRNHLLSHSITYQYSKFEIGIKQIVSTGGYFDNLNLIKRDSSNRLSAFGAISWMDATLSIQLNNITDDRVRDFPLTPVAGPTFYSTLTYKW